MFPYDSETYQPEQTSSTYQFGDYVRVFQGEWAGYEGFVYAIAPSYRIVQILIGNEQLLSVSENCVWLVE